ncbi:acyltransferase 3 [Truncatella angustata]|uniref:Acyltransferase 3 n=1 Tax=Truncatella angustata TaxID=152316 RepID=A0A9P8ZWR4_9PEZI|nr:acyltransferase 3 [Truncatella angustata]KAH6654017.1 acyltransferase 3 [Truncatella angustata]
MPNVLALTVFLLPSYFQSLFSRSSRSANDAKANKKPLHATAYLDGLRGVAALIVYVYHWNYLWFPFLRKGYGSPAAENVFLQRPIVRILHSGRASVTLFFVISGYVITLKTLSTIHAGQTGRALEVLSGSLFRRPFRLYLPIIVQTLVILVMIRWDLFQHDVTGFGSPPRMETLSQQLDHWWINFQFMVNPFRAISGRQNLYSPPYNGHLWTIPIEFKGSVLVFALLLAFARCRRWIHLGATGACAIWLAQMGDMDMTLFCAGMILAEISLLFPPSDGEASSLPWQRTPAVKSTKQIKTIRLFRHMATIALFLLAVYCMCYPEQDGPASPGYITLTKMVPVYYRSREDFIEWFWTATGSILFIPALMYSPTSSATLFPSPRRLLCCFGAVAGGRLRLRRAPQDIEQQQQQQQQNTAAIEQLQPQPQPQAQPLLQRMFTHPFSQYLGHISYALYLTHGCVNHTIGTQFLNPAFAGWRAAEQKAAASQQEGVATVVLAAAWNAYVWKAAWATIVNTFVLFWVSDVFWRLVDARAVLLTRWLGEKAKAK